MTDIDDDTLRSAMEDHAYATGMMAALVALSSEISCPIVFGRVRAQMEARRQPALAIIRAAKVRNDRH